MKSGKFSLELLNAETKEPMKEFTASDGKVYVEAEPDLEYFIRCYDEREERDDGVVVTLHVDGTNLSYKHKFSTKTSDLGLWKRQNGVSTHHSLKMILRKRDRGADCDSNAMPHVGNVQAKFYEVIYLDEMVEKADLDATSCLDQAFAAAPPVASKKKKAFASVSGTAVSTGKTRRTRLKKKWKLGRYLGEMTIHYTSTLGLSLLGLLAPTPDGAAAAAPAASNSSSTSTTPRNDTTHDDDGGRASNTSTEPKRKRVRTEPTIVRVVSPDHPKSGDNNFIDLTTGDDDNCSARRTLVIDLTEGDD